MRPNIDCFTVDRRNGDQTFSHWIGWWTMFLQEEMIVPQPFYYKITKRRKTCFRRFGNPCWSRNHQCIKASINKQKIVTFSHAFFRDIVLVLTFPRFLLEQNEIFTNLVVPNGQWNVVEGHSPMVLHCHLLYASGDARSDSSVRYRNVPNVCHESNFLNRRSLVPVVS